MRAENIPVRCPKVGCASAFMKVAAAKYGWKKGALSEAMEEAVEDWIKKQETQKD